jgi:hypothetical protein
MNLRDLSRPALLPARSVGRASRGRRLAGALALNLALALPLTAQPLTGGVFELVGGVTSGGGTCSGGTLSITGWAASAGAGTSSGDVFELTCGLLGIYGLSGTNVVLNAELTDAGKVRLWWAPDLTGFQLEFSMAIGPAAVWQPVLPSPVDNTYTTMPLQPASFFRLREP